MSQKRYRPDPQNARLHPERNQDLIRQSLAEVGAGRSILVGGDDTVIAGNGVYEQAVKLGLKIVEVEVGPDELVAVKRADLVGEQATRAALLDNAASDTSTWDVAALRRLEADAPHLLADLDELHARLQASLPSDDPAAIPVSSTAPATTAVGGDVIEDVLPEEDTVGDIPDLIAPFPWFGGKARVASRIWARFGDIDNYVEPFCGSAAVLLATETPPRITTLNDADGFIANFWRALAAAPDDVAQHLDWPVNEIDLFARHVYLIKRSGELRQRLEADPDYYDARIAGWWCWGACAWIGTGWCSGKGPWTIDDDGALLNVRESDAGRGVNRKLPHLGDAGQGVNRQLPNLGDAGRGVRGRITDHLRDYMGRLADALRTARVACGDWARVVTPSVTTRHGLTAVLLDPPYGEGEQEYSAGGNADKELAASVWAWATEHGDDPQLRIAVCGYDDGRALPPGWTALRWTARKGYQATEKALENPRREIVWFSPHCLR